MKLQHRDLQFEFIKSDALAKGFIAGIATTPRVDSYGDIIAAGAFQESITTRGVSGPTSVKMLAQHRSDTPIGNWTKLEYDGDKLMAEGQLDLDDTVGQKYHNYAKKGQIGSFSVGFQTKVRKYDEENDILTILKGDLREISLVTFPANEDAIITDVRSEGNNIKLSDMEKKIAQEYDLTRTQACALIRSLRTSGLFEPVTIPIVEKEDDEILKMLTKLQDNLELRNIDNMLERLSCSLGAR